MLHQDIIIIPLYMYATKGEKSMENSNSFWLLGQTLYENELQSDLKTAVCIVGGGLTGIYTAYLLAKSGVEVSVLEAKQGVGNNATTHSTGKLSVQHNTIYSKLTIDEAKLHFNINHDAIKQAIEPLPSHIAQKTTSFLFTTTEKGVQQLSNEWEMYQKIDIPSFQTTEIELDYPILNAIAVTNDYQIQPYEFLQFYLKKALEAGAKVYTNARAIKIQHNERQLQTEHFTVQYDKLIISSHYPIESILGLQTTKLTINRSYLSATKCYELLEGQYLQYEQPGRTIRTATAENQNYFIYGATVSPQNDFPEQLITDEVTKTFDLSTPEFLWMNQDVMTPNSLPLIGPITENEDSLLIATGYNKWGLSQSLVAANLLTQYVLNEKNDAFSLYTPTRTHLGQMILNSLQLTEFFVGGYVTRMNAPKCTHLGCKTNWNELEETWDCPCHGSRFAKDGSVIEGPAVYPLQLTDDM